LDQHRFEIVQQARAKSALGGCVVSGSLAGAFRRGCVDAGRTVRFPMSGTHFVEGSLHRCCGAASSFRRQREPPYLPLQPRCTGTLGKVGNYAAHYGNNGL
jgi:hypothetical protein